MAGNDLHAEALAVALRNATPEIGVAVICQLVTVNGPAKQNGRRGPEHAPGGEIPAWHLVLTLSDPVNLAGLKLRHMAFIGDGAPELARIPAAVASGCEQLRTLARQRLASQQQ